MRGVLTKLRPWHRRPRSSIERAKYIAFSGDVLTSHLARGSSLLVANIGKYFDMDGIVCLDDEFDISMLTKELYESKLQAVKRNNRKMYGMMSADDMLYSLIQREER